MPTPRATSRRSLALLCGALLSGCGDAEDAPDAARPDILLITIDTIRADALGCYGREQARTPHMDRLAADGVRFQYAFSPRGATLPAMTTILTGVSPLAHGVLGNDHVLQTKQPTLAELLKREGYTTAAFLTNQCPTLIDRDDHAGRGFDHRACGKDDTEIQYRWDERAADLALAWMQQAADGPVFVWVHFMDPHGAHDPRPELYRGRLPPAPLLTNQAEQLASWEERNETPPADMLEILWALYDAEVEGVDQMVGRVVAGVRARRAGVAPIIVLAGDHGEEFYEHNNFRGHADSVYDTVLRVPMIVNAPGRVPAGIVPTYFAELEDILPTTLDLIGAKPLARIEGESLLPYLERDLDRTAGVGSAFGLWDSNILTVRRPRFRYVWNQLPGGQVQPVFKYRERFDFYNEPDMLFDHAQDPREQANLLRDTPAQAAVEMRRAMRKQLHEWTRHERHLKFTPQTIEDERLAEELRQLGYK